VPAVLEREQREPLVGKLVRVQSARLGGSFVALVREARPREAVVQRPGPKPWASSISARCCGDVLHVPWTEVKGVLNRRRAPGHQVVPLVDFLESAGD